MALETILIESKERNQFLSSDDIKKRLNQTQYLLKVIRKQNKILLFDPFQKTFFLMDKYTFEKYGKNKIGKIHLSKGIKPKNELFGVLFILTDDCNFRCSYCLAFGGEGPSKYNNWEILKLTIDYLAKRNKEIGISFVGSGEPTLHFPLLIKTVEYIKKRLSPEKVKIFEISTNGVIEEKKILWLADNFKKLQISCDGPPEIQDIQRPLFGTEKSSKYVEKTIKVLVKYQKNFQTSTVITPYSLKKERKIFKYLFELGVPRMTFRTLMEIGRAAKFANNSFFKTQPQMIKSLFKFQEWGDYFSQKVAIPSNVLIEKKGFRMCPVGSTLVISPGGKILTCPLIREGKDFISSKIFQRFAIGKVDVKKGKVLINQQKRKILGRFYERVKKCQKCEFKLCIGGCALMNSLETGSLYIPSDKTCFEVKTHFKFLLQYLINKHLIKLKPRIEFQKKSPFLSFLHSRFKLFITNGEQIKGNLFLKLNLDKINYSNLIKKILNWHQRSKGRMWIFLISPQQKSKLNSNAFKAFKNFLLFLKKNRIIFKVIKPIWACEKILKKEKNFFKEFSIPSNCLECQEMFFVKNGRVVFCNGKLGPKINKIFNREEIYQLFKKSTSLLPPKCFAFSKSFLKHEKKY